MQALFSALFPFWLRTQRTVYCYCCLLLLIMSIIHGKVLQVTSMIFMQGSCSSSCILQIVSYSIQMQVQLILCISDVDLTLHYPSTLSIISQTLDMKLINTLTKKKNKISNCVLVLILNHTIPIICQFCYKDAWGSQLQLRGQTCHCW